METGEKGSKPGIEFIDFEKRRCPRFHIILPVEYRQTKSSFAHSWNISEEGSLVYFPEEMDVSEYLRLKLFFTIGPELNKIEVLAEVVWMDNHLSKNQKYYPYGVKFLDISPEDATKLRNFLRSLSSPLNQTLDMEAYEFYWRDSQGKDHLIGILPERRKDPKRITSNSIMNWVKKILGESTDSNNIFFIAIKIDKCSGEILKFEDNILEGTPP